MAGNGNGTTVAVTPGVRMFDGTGFQKWRTQMEDYLYLKDLELPLGDKPEKTDDAAWKKLDRKVLGAIRMCLSENVSGNVANETTTKGMMKTLADLYEKPTINNKISLMKRLITLKMAEGTSINANLSTINVLINQLRSVGFIIDDEWKASIILAALPDSWESMRAAVTHSSGTEQLKCEDVIEKILTEEVRLKDSADGSSTVAFNVERGKHGNQNKGGFGQGQSRRGKPTCWRCGKVGHIKRYCKEEGESNVVLADYSDCLLVSGENKIDSWVLDSGASQHTTRDRNMLKNFVAGNFGMIRTAGNKLLKVHGMGDVDLKMSNGSVWKIRKVKYVPTMTCNLISVSQLDADGYKTQFVKNSWRVTKGAIEVAQGSKTGKLYELKTHWKSSSVSKRGKRHSQPLTFGKLTGSYEGESKKWELLRNNKKGEEPDSLTTNPRPLPKAILKTKKIWRVKKNMKERMENSNMGNGVDYSECSSVVKLVAFKDVPRLEDKRELELGSTPVGVRG